MFYDPERHHRASYRLHGHNYRLPGWYFVTICTKDMGHYFGKIRDKKMRLSPAGIIARECWRRIPTHFPHVELDAFVVMPNHVHGIVVINEYPGSVGTQNFASLQSHGVPNHNVDNLFGPQSMNLASIIRGFKIGVTKWTNNNNEPFAWQPRYHDRIIRDTDALEQIRYYIRNNPRVWWRDRNNAP